jgi:hypothetical protein
LIETNALFIRNAESFESTAKIILDCLEGSAALGIDTDHPVFEGSEIFMVVDGIVENFPNLLEAVTGYRLLFVRA